MAFPKGGWECSMALSAVADVRMRTGGAACNTLCVVVYGAYMYTIREMPRN